MAVDLSLGEELQLREGYKFEIRQVSVLGGGWRGHQPRPR